MPVVYNITVQVDKRMAGPWLQWLQREHIPAIMQTGFFTHYKILRLLDMDESESLTYAVQYTAASLTHYREYESLHAAAFSAASFAKWGDAFIAFKTIMEAVD